MADFKYHTGCDRCGSKDNKAVYSDGSEHCFGCGFTVPSKEFLEDKTQTNHRSKKLKETQQETEVNEKLLKAIITDEENQEIKSSTKASGAGYRGIKDYVLKYFGVRTKFNDEGEVEATYYPVTYKGKLSGYKVRKHPKIFSSIGRTGKECDLFGQFRFTQGGRVCLIVGGEHDQLAAYQILRDYQIRKGNEGYDPPCVVSPTIGETSSKKQLALHYKFFDNFEKVILCYDNDEAGKEAMEDCIEVLPKGKVYTMQMRHKDPNKYIEDGDEAKFLNEYYTAKKYVPAGIVGSSELYDKLIEASYVKKIPLPPFMKTLDDMIGSVELGTIGTLAAGSGSGKTSFTNEMVYFWIFNSPYKVGIVSLELTCGQYAQALLSRHIEKKISSMKDPDAKIEFLTKAEVKAKADELFKTESGDDRFVVVDERDGSIEVLQDKIEEMIISCGCKVIIADPISDIFDGLSTDQQAVFMKWQKSMVKNYNVTFINIAHIRKGSSNSDSASSGAFVPEEAIIGSSTLVKSSSWVIMLQRNKYAEDEITRNTTTVHLTKNRSNGITGKAGSIYYCNETHKLHDFDTYFEGNIPVDF